MTCFRRAMPLALLLSVLTSSPAFAIEEAGYATHYTQEVLPWAAQYEIQSLNGKAGVDIAYICFEKPQADDALVIATGRTESLVKYFEVAYDIFHSDLSLSVCIYDHRGQGLSGRLISDTRKGHVDWFSYYAKDMKKVVNRVKGMGYTRVFMLAHSMGGGAAVYAAQQYPDLLDGLVLTAPMLAVNTDPYPTSITYALVSTLTWWGQGESFLMGKTYWDPTGSDEDFAENAVTRSHARWLMNENIYLQLTSAYPQQALGGATNRWLRESIRASWSMWWNANKLQTPTILFQAPDEKYVKKSAHDDICGRAPSCELVRLDAANFADSEGRMPRHELLMETDDVRNVVMSRMLDFLRSLGVSNAPSQANQAAQH